MGAIRPSVFSVVAIGFGALCFDAAVAGAEQRPHPEGLLRVTSATLGGNCGAAAGNVTWTLVKACDGKERCSLKLLGDVGTGSSGACAKRLTLEYRCGNRARRFSATLRETARPGAELTLYCGAPPKPSELSTATLTLGTPTTPRTNAGDGEGAAPEQEPTLTRAVDCTPGAEAAHGDAPLSPRARDALADPPEALEPALRQEVEAAWRRTVEPMFRRALGDPGAEVSAEVRIAGRGDRRYPHFRAWNVGAEDSSEVLVEVLHGAGAEAAAERFGGSFEEIRIDEGEGVAAIDFPADRAVLDTIGGMGTEALLWLAGETYLEARKARPARPLAEALHAAALSHGLYGLFAVPASANNGPGEDCEN